MHEVTNIILLATCIAGVVHKSLKTSMCCEMLLFGGDSLPVHMRSAIISQEQYYKHNKHDTVS